MLQYSYEQLSIIVSIPIVTIFLVWTTAIFFKNRRKWSSYDIPIVSLFILSIIRNLTILSYVLILTLKKQIFHMDYCSILVWIFNSIHTFQASNLSTLAIIGLISTKLKRKNRNLKHFLNSSHVIYHLFCLIVLCACVGVAAILAQNNLTLNLDILNAFAINPCKLMPYDLDLKYNVFIIVLHVFLVTISFFSLLFTSYHLYKLKRQQFNYLKKSNSDLSDSSFSNNNTIIYSGGGSNNDKNYYDTYTIQRGGGGNNQYHCQNFYIGSVRNRDVWNSSDMSNLSATVSSTNSRRPCISNGNGNEERNSRTGLETICPILIVCYMVYHIPVLVLSIYPRLLHPWPVPGIILWLGLLQDILLPIGLGLVDSRFNNFVSDVYKCSRRRLDEKLPQVGLDGKFRAFSSQPQSLEIVQIAQERNMKSLQVVEHRFPITNGSLYTSIDGRLPVIHNYRRNKDPRVLKFDPSSSNPSLHLSHLKRPDMGTNVFNCSSCEVDLCPSHSNLHHLSPDYINRKLNETFHHHNVFQNILKNSNSLSHENLNFDMTSSTNNSSIMKNSRNLLRLNRMKLSKSDDTLSQSKINFEEKKKINQKNEQIILDYSSSDDESTVETLSSKSDGCSITTEANGDFHFYQNRNVSEEKSSENMRENINRHLELLNNDLLLAKYSKCDTSLENFAPKNSILNRSQSKRSLENFQAFLEDRNNNDYKIERSNSYMNLDGNRKLLRSTSKLSDCTYNFNKKIKSVEYLPNTNASTWLIEDYKYVCNNVKYNRENDDNVKKPFRYIGSVPDLKKVFISEYI